MVNYLTAQASGNWIAIVIIVIILIPAIRTTVKHMKGEGDCCGGPKEKVPKKLTVHIEGMHCQNCKNRIEKHVNELDGVICKVKLNKKIAVVSLYKDVDESLIKDTIEKLDFTVVGME